MDETIQSPKKLKKFGRYEIRSELGRGGMATVYLGYDTLFEREVAVKVLPAEFLHDPQFSVRFHREAKIVAALEHPAIVPVYDVGEVDGLPYFVMRYMDGGSLADVLAKGEISLKEVARIINIIAPALDDAHQKGIIHRDIKPANILFDKHKQPYLSDYGIAKISGSQTNVTGSAIIGTPAYMSPEQAQGKEIDGRSDIYALGAIIYRMLTGTRPFIGETPMSMAIKHITDPTPDILNENPKLPPSATTFIYKAMAKDPDYRFQTAVELADALNALSKSADTVGLHTLPSKTKLSLPKAVPEEKKENNRIGWIVAGVVIVGLIGMGLLSKLFFGINAARRTPTPTTRAASTPLANLPASPLPPPTVAVLPSSVPSPSPLPPSSPTPASKGLPIIGGADKVAFIANDNVWLMNLDGSDLIQLTVDGARKSKLQWLPDNKTLIYVVGKCIQTFDTEADRVDNITCIEQAEYFEAFQISPSGKQIAISMNRELFILPFDLEALSKAKKRFDLIAMHGCFYDESPVRDVRWSSDESKLAIVFVDAADNRHIDTIRIMDITNCETKLPHRLDEFPAQRFKMSGYNSAHPFLPDFDWDGEDLFLMNTFKRNDGFGYFYTYNARSHKARQLTPAPSSANSTCCYRDARWSPDGSHFMVAFQDIAKGADAKIELYYLLYGTLGTGETYERIHMPVDFFKNPKEKLQFALRPAQ